MNKPEAPPPATFQFHVGMTSLLILLTSGVLASDDVVSDAACTMTDTGKGNLWKMEMYSLHGIQPYKEIHCRFQGSDELLSFSGNDTVHPGCDSCVRSSGYSATCGCVCPPGGGSAPGGNCTWTFYGQLQFNQTATNGTKSCTCNGHPGPPIPPAPPPAPPKPPAPPGPCKAKLDVVIVLDGSASIVAADWTLVKAFANRLVDAFHLSTDQAEIGALQFATGERVISPITADAARLKSLIGSESQMRGGTNTYAGFAAAKLLLDSHQRAGLKGKLVFLITDGRQNRGLPAKSESVKLQAEGATIFGIGVGNHIDAQELESWVSTPVSEHFFSVAAFDKLDQILKKLISNACPPP